MKELLSGATPWQKRVAWAAITALSLYAITWLALKVILSVTSVLNFLQPILIPVAVAGVMAYLLHPVVEWFRRRGIGHTQAVFYVFLLVLLPLVLILTWIIPEIYHQSMSLGQSVPNYVTKGRDMVIDAIKSYQVRYSDNPYVQQATAWLSEQLPLLPPKIWKFISSSLEGFLGVFGFLLGLILVPICLFYFLKESGSIAQKWSDYLPLRASAFKDEVVGTLNEINGYLIAFFRGQLLISVIDGILTGIALLIMGLNFALLIGLMVAILALIPYLGVILCWLPAVIIAAVQFQDWQHPLYVTLIFIGVQQLEGWAISPKIMSESVGLHPLTVIVAVLTWSLLIGGLLGAILAVPLTATLKVLLKRYVWDRSFQSTELAAANHPLLATAREET